MQFSFPRYFVWTDTSHRTLNLNTHRYSDPCGHLPSTIHSARAFLGIVFPPTSSEDRVLYWLSSFVGPSWLYVRSLVRTSRFRFQSRTSKRPAGGVRGYWSCGHVRQCAFGQSAISAIYTSALEEFWRLVSLQTLELLAEHCWKATHNIGDVCISAITEYVAYGTAGLLPVLFSAIIV